MKKRHDDKCHIMAGDRGLLAAVLLHAVADVREGNGFAKGAEVWIDSDRNDGPFAFLRVCEALDLAPDAVRRTIRRTGERRGSCR